MCNPSAGRGCKYVSLIMQPACRRLSRNCMDSSVEISLHRPVLSFPGAGATLRSNRVLGFIKVPWLNIHPLSSTAQFLILPFLLTHLLVHPQDGLPTCISENRTKQKLPIPELFKGIQSSFKKCRPPSPQPRKCCSISQAPAVNQMRMHQSPGALRLQAASGGSQGAQGDLCFRAWEFHPCLFFPLRERKSQVQC